ncbi:MAG TPA: hypothetical protein VH141_19755 [Pseudonocardia sp.]|jgi:hypothetical protein|nr:hypothetical protein [Pseudonocardia sp.]
MGLLDWVIGTRRPAAALVPRPVSALYAALLAVNRPGAHFAVRDGRPDGVDLVAHLKFAEPDWYGYFAKLSPRTAFRVFLRLDEARAEVRWHEQECQVEQLAGVFYYARVEALRSGQPLPEQKSWVFEHSRPHRAARALSSQSVRGQLRAAVIESGWTWRAVPEGDL